MSDGEAHDLLKLSSPPTEALALAFLLNKLLYLSQNWGLVPIVGKGYAADMVAWKARKARSSRAKELPGRPTQRNATRANCAAFAAGLSFGFVDDTDLVAAPLEALARFKQENLSLLHRSQSYIEGVASKFSRLLDHDRLADEIELLRQEACEERAKLDEEARRGLISAGIQIAGKALAAGVSAFAGGVILTSHSGPAAIAGTVSALAAAAPDTFDLLRKLKDRHGTDLAYLFRLGDTLSLEAAVGLPPR